MTTKFGSSSFFMSWALVSLPRESMSAVTARSPHNSIARGRSSICHDRATRRSVLISVSVMIAAENGPIPCASQRYRRKWDREFESVLLQQPVCLSGEPRGRKRKAPHFGGGLRVAWDVRRDVQASNRDSVALSL